MTDENQNQGAEIPNEEKPEFGSGETGGNEQEPSFGADEVNKLAKMNADAQQFITELKSETAEMRGQIKQLQEELAKSNTIDDLIDTYGQQGTEPGPKTPQVNEQELLAKLKAELQADMTAAEVKAKEDSNWRESVKQAEERFGEKYASYVDSRAKELNISVKDMEDYAKNSPSVFMELLGQKSQGSAQPTQPSLSSPVQGSDDIKVRYSKYVQMRKLDTPEGREANRMLLDPKFMEQYRLAILKG